MKKAITRISCVMICLLFSATSLVDAKIYKWKDSNGVIHYSQDPPPRGVKTLSTMESIQSSASANSSAVSANLKELAKKLRSIKVHSGQLE